MRSLISCLVMSRFSSRTTRCRCFAERGCGKSALVLSLPSSPLQVEEVLASDDETMSVESSFIDRSTPLSTCLPLGKLAASDIVLTYAYVS